MSRNERRPLLQGGGPFSWAGEVLDASDPIMTGTVGGTAINLSACALGASMLSLPYTMSIAGPGIALDFLLLFAIMAYFAAQAVIRAGLAAKKSTYAEIVRTYFGPVCGFIVNILLSLALIVAAISYIVGLADLLPVRFLISSFIFISPLSYSSCVDSRLMFFCFFLLLFYVAYACCLSR